MRKYDLEDRLVKFAINILNIAEKLPNTKAGKNLESQIVRSGTSPALNYGEAQNAESRKDFAHKIKIILKELRETFICLKIIKNKPLLTSFNEIEMVMQECNELVAIFFKSYKTAKAKINI